MRGIKKDKSLNTNPRVHLPITLAIMADIRKTLSDSPHNCDNIMLWAACCLAFFSLLRCIEFVCLATHLTLQSNPTTIQVTIKQSKTDPFHQDCKLCLGKTGADICPITAILPHLAVRGSAPGPQFILNNGDYLTRQLFSTRLSTVLEQAGINSKGYNTHSFRIGAAMTAKEKGIDDIHIKMLGRWKSSAYQLYIRPPQQHLAKLSKRLVSNAQKE